LVAITGSFLQTAVSADYLPMNTTPKLSICFHIGIEVTILPHSVTIE